jgi:uncharacterized membrane protein
VTCECGNVRLLPYDTRWECERCGRRWNTGQIPAAEYEQLARRVRRYKFEAVAFGVLLVAVFAPLMILVDVRLGITGLIVFFAWAFLVRPRQRRKLVEATRGTSDWQLTPE